MGDRSHKPRPLYAAPYQRLFWRIRGCPVGAHPLRGGLQTIGFRDSRILGAQAGISAANPQVHVEPGLYAFPDSRCMEHPGTSHSPGLRMRLRGPGAYDDAPAPLGEPLCGHRLFPEHDSGCGAVLQALRHRCRFHPVGYHKLPAKGKVFPGHQPGPPAACG